MPPAAQIAQKITDNPMLTATGRIVQFLTLPVVTIGLWLGGNYLSNQSTAMDRLTSRVTVEENFDSGANSRLTALETQAQLGHADRLAFQDKTEQTLAKIVDQNAQLLAQIAAVTARLDEADRGR